VKLNFSEPARGYLRAITREGKHEEALFFHCIAVMHSPAYREEHADALKQNWPRIPLPASAQLLAASGKLGELLAKLLDPEKGVKGVTEGATGPEFRCIGIITPTVGTTIDPASDLLIEAGWGHATKDGAAMPGKGKAIAREYTAEERESLARRAAELELTPDEAIALIGEKTFDIYLNDRAYWTNIPQRVWEYKMGGHQVIKKWLSYREAKLLGRAITPDEAHYVRDMARRIAAICLLQPQLDANYAAIKDDLFAWSTAAVNEETECKTMR
jgi:hypothetical protein